MAYVQSVGAELPLPGFEDAARQGDAPRSGDRLAGVAAEDGSERVAAQMALADVPLKHFLNEAVIPYEDDEVTRLIIDNHDGSAFAPVSGLDRRRLPRLAAVGLRPTKRALAKLAPGITPEMAAAVSKLMRMQDLILVAKKCRVVTRFRNTIGLPGRLSTRLQPNHPTDDPTGIAACILDGLLLGSGDAVIGINPATDTSRRDRRCCDCSTTSSHTLRDPDAELRPDPRHDDASRRSIAARRSTWCSSRSPGTEAANRSFGVDLALLRGGARGGAVAEPRHGRRQCHVFRDRPGHGAVGQRASRRRSADLRGAGLCGGARLRSAAGQHASSASSARNICTTASRSSAPASRTISAASCSACRWAATSATPTTPRPTRTTWTTC